MSEILFISTDKCVITLIDQLRPSLKTAIDTVADYSEGVKKIFDRRPCAVFMQSTIAGVPCAKLVNQVKLLLGEEPLHLVLLSDEENASYASAAHFEAVLDLCMPPDALADDARRILAALPGIEWEGEPPSSTPSPSNEVEEGALELTFPIDSFLDFSPLPPPPAAQGETVQLDLGAPAAQALDLFLEGALDGLSDPSPPARALSPAPHLAPVTDARRIEKTCPGALMESMSEDPAPDVPQRTPMGPLKRVDTAGRIPPPKGRPNPPPSPPDPLSVELPSPPRWGAPLTKGVLLLLSVAVLVLGAGWFREARKARAAMAREAPVRYKIPAQPKLPPKSELPAFIPQERLDPAYQGEHPGWQRFPADGVEYLVFREKGALKAIQVVSHKKGELSGSFLDSCLRVATGAAGYRFRRSSRQGIYLVTEGALAGGGEIAIYRDGAAGEVRGFVITLP